MPANRSSFVTRTALESLALGLFLDEKSVVASSLCNVQTFDKGDKKIYQRDNSVRRVVNTLKSTDSEADIVDQDVFATSVSALEHKLKAPINPRDLRDADLPQLMDESELVEHLTMRHLLAMEVDFATLAFTSGNYATSLTSALSSGSKWNEANGSPETNLLTVNDALRNSCGRKANAVTMDALTLEKLRLSPEWRSRTQYTNGGPIPDSLIKAFFGVDYLFVSSARVNGAVKGAAESLSAPFGDDVVFSVFDPNAGMRSQNAFVMGVLQSGFWTKTYEDVKRNGAAGSMRYVEVGTEYVFAPGFVESSSSSKISAAYLLRDVVA